MPIKNAIPKIACRARPIGSMYASGTPIRQRINAIIIPTTIPAIPAAIETAMIVQNIMLFIYIIITRFNFSKERRANPCQRRMKVFRFTINASLGNSFNTAFDSVSGKISGLVSQMKGLNSIGKEIPVNIGKRLASIGGAGLRIRLGAKAWNFGKILPVVYQRQAKKLKAAWPGVRKVLDLDSEDQFKQMRQDMIISDPRFLRGKRLPSGAL